MRISELSWTRRAAAILCLLLGGWVAAPGVSQEPAPPKADAPKTDAPKVEPPKSDAASQSGADAGKPSSLGIRQKRVEGMMEELERKFKSLSATLQESEPQRAQRLIDTMQEAKKKLVQQRMGEVARLLDGARLDSATGEQEKILSDLRLLIALLLAESEENKDEEKTLAELKEHIERVLAEQQRQRRETDKINNKDRALSDLAEQIKAVEDLIKKQEGVLKDTEDASPKGAAALNRVADAQHQVRQQTQAVADAIAKAAGQNPPQGDPKSGDPKSGDPKSGDPKSGDPKSGDPKSGDSKSGDSKSGDSKSGDSKSGDSKSGDSKSGDSPSGNKPSQPKEPAQQALERAAGNQQNAEKNLQNAKGKEAQKDEQRAVADLKTALDELKKEQRRLASLPPEAFKQLAEQQKQLAQQTGKIAEQMQKSSKGGESGGQQGQKSVEDAQQAMEEAGGDLDQQDPENAGRKQDEAIKQLEKALREIEERLNQLREETQEEKLARLEGRFREMLARQEAVTAETARLEKLRAAEGQLPRAERLNLGKQAAEERALAELAFQACEIIVEDGTSVAFPRVVEALRDDLTRAAELLESRRTDQLTQHLQQEIETTLKELIAALQRVQKERKEGGGGGGGGGGEPPLLPSSAELKLLKASQLRVNRRTEAFDKLRPQGPLDEALRKEIRGLAVQQQDIAIITEEILNRSLLLQ